jgi:hypothetical protein
MRTHTSKSSPDKSSAAIAARRTHPALWTTPTHKQLVKLAHLVLEQHPKETDLGTLMELLKTSVSRTGFTFTNSGEISRALDSALWQRRKLR